MLLTRQEFEEYCELLANITQTIKFLRQLAAMITAKIADVEARARSEQTKAENKNKRGRRGARQIYDRAEDQKLVRDLRATGLTIAEFACQRNLSIKHVRLAVDRVRKRRYR